MLKEKNILRIIGNIPFLNTNIRMNFLRFIPYVDMIFPIPDKLEQVTYDDLFREVYSYLNSNRSMYLLLEKTDPNIVEKRRRVNKNGSTSNIVEIEKSGLVFSNKDIYLPLYITSKLKHLELSSSGIQNDLPYLDLLIWSLYQEIKRRNPIMSDT